MPIYEYECPACAERFEEMVKVDAPAPPCPKCGASDVRKLVSAAAFMLKGGGWYKDHYGLKKSTGSSGDGGSSGGSGTGTGGASSAGSSGGTGSSGSGSSAAAT